MNYIVCVYMLYIHALSHRSILHHQLLPLLHFINIIGSFCEAALEYTHIISLLLAYNSRMLECSMLSKLHYKLLIATKHFYFLFSFVYKHKFARCVMYTHSKAQHSTAQHFFFIFYFFIFSHHSSNAVFHAIFIRVFCSTRRATAKIKERKK